ncbi:MAG: hypothetical protein OEY86_06065 [Nitrospira sp.]|nr:hypothetical protein [Nitrospira sp.]
MPLRHINPFTEVLVPMKRLVHPLRCIQSVLLAGLICSPLPGVAENIPQQPEDQAPIETTADAESSDSRVEESTSNDEAFAPDTEESASSTDDSAVSAYESEPSPDETTAETAEQTVDEDSDPEKADPSIILKGRVWRTKPGIVFLKTPVGLLSLSSKTTLKDLKASQEISFWVHDAHLAIDIRKRKDGSLVHRYLSGPFTPSESDETTWRTWTPDGTKSFELGAHKRSLAALHPGDPVTVEVDEANTVIGVHDLQFDLQIGQVPPPGSTVHLLLTGTVAKMKSNFIFLRTPIGVVNVNTKIGIKGAKIGQTWTLHIHDQTVIADLTEKKAE